MTTPTMQRERFRHMGGDVWHCNRCHRLVRTDDTWDPIDAALMLEAHWAFVCGDDLDRMEGR